MAVRRARGNATHRGDRASRAGAGKGPAHARLATIRKALASADAFSALTTIREAIAEENGAQKVVVWAHACILETSSAGLTILFDRFTLPEIGRIERALVRIGAARTASDLKGLRTVFERAVDGGRPALDAADDLNESELGKTMDKAYRAHVQEMETKLLAYCAQHAQELAGG
jgi:hypothetical protein